MKRRRWRFKPRDGLLVSHSGVVWPAGECATLASAGCQQCHGLGQVWKQTRIAPCGCVYRAVFRICLAAARECEIRSHSTKTGSMWQWLRGYLRPENQSRVAGVFCRANEEYLADIYCVARRELSALEWRVFRRYWLGEGNWRECAGDLRLERGKFFHTVYAVERKLGRVFVELRPYALYPVDEYFSLWRPNPLESVAVSPRGKRLGGGCYEVC